VHEDILEELRRRWSLELAPEALAALAGGEGDEPLADAHRDDRLLAWASLAGAPAALAELDARALVPAGVHARARGLPPALVDDALQLARVRLLLGDDGRAPGLRAYRGRGSLTAFVRTVVSRLAIDLVRREREPPADHVDAILADAHPDPELELMRAQYADVLREALRGAWRDLQAHDRFVLGLQLHEQLDLDAIARLYQIHRATAARRAATARAALIAATRDRIRAQLAVGSATVDSILRIVTTSVAWSALAEP